MLKSFGESYVFLDNGKVKKRVKKGDIYPEKVLVMTVAPKTSFIIKIFSNKKISAIFLLKGQIRNRVTKKETKKSKLIIKAPTAAMEASLVK